MTETTSRWAIAIHGGAGTIARERMPADREAEFRAALAQARDAGAAVLAADGSALDAVEAAIVALEDDPLFNAGRGAALTWDGIAELDAAIMDGRTRSAGAAAGITRTRNPIRLTRAIMERSPHVFLAGAGADAFAGEQGLAQIENDWFVVPHRQRQLAELRSHDLDALDVEFKFGTVGAVACDTGGHVAAGTSTGGMTGKRWGRIGDSPVIGAGTYADDRACAVSATGAGEYFIRAGVAHEIGARMRLKGESAQVAADAVIAEVGALDGDGGVIVAAPDGRTAFAFNTPGMYRARADSSGLAQVGIFADED